MNHLFICSMPALILAATAAAAQPDSLPKLMPVQGPLRVHPETADFFVSPQGQDRWSGRRADPGGGEGPFATVSRARQAVRELLKSRKEPRPIRVVLRGGTYYLNEPLEFGPEDSGAAEAPVVYAAAAGEQVVLSGGRRIENGRWGERNGRKLWVTDLPEVKAGTWRFRQLFVNGERRPRTRLPRQGEYQIQALPDVPISDAAWEKQVRRFVYAGTDIQRWQNLGDVEVVAPCRWVDNRLPIQAVDPDKRIVTFDRSSVFNLVELYHTKPSTYWVENVFEALDTPGQWYLDRALGRLFYLPAGGEDMAAAELVAPRLAQLVRVVGRKDAPVRFLRLEGLTFAHTEWQPPADWAASSQAATDVPGAIFLTHASRCAIRQCRVEHVGTFAIEVGAGCRDVEIARNRLTDLGGGGVKVGHGSQRTMVADNEIAHGGRLFMSAVGIWVGHSAGNQIVHNLIQDLHYSGISVGWQWNFKPSQAVSNIVEYNHIHDLGHGLLSDLGGIYTLGVSPGTRLRGNLIHDVKARAYGGWGIYPDEGSSEIVVEDNLAYRCSSSPFFAHINRKITVQNNIFALGEQCQVERAGAMSGPELEYAFLRNIVYYRQGQLVGYWDPKNHSFAYEHNLYWNASGAPVTFNGKSFAEWQAAGQDKGSLIADPLFVEPQKGDFRLRPGSPADKIGFKPWDFSAVGPRPSGTVKAFPTAEGFGAGAVGGRGGRVIEVTNLNDSGEGSLRSAMEASGPRICVFRVSGTITLKNAIRVRTPYLTVAGQTSPGGVQIKGSGQPEGDWGVWFVNGAHDIIVRHLRVRMGGNMKHDAGNNLLCYGTAEPGVHDVIFDHCSVSWGSDTQLDWYGSYLDRATFQWNLIAECFMGQHIGGNRAPKNITLHHNLYANLGSRTPLMQHADVFDFRNNVIYNWSGNNASVFGQFALNASAFGNVVGNLWLAGPEGGYPYLNVGNGGPVRVDGSKAEAGGTRLYLAGNWGPRCPTGCANDWSGHGVNTWDYYELNHDGSTHLVDQAQYDAGKPFPAPPVTMDSLSNLLDKVLAGAGAHKPSRDPIDLRIVKSVRDKSGTSRVNTTGPWPDLATGAPPPPMDSDHDGMPEGWERAHGLDPNNPRDGAAIAANGYTNLENYLNELAGDPIP